MHLYFDGALNRSMLVNKGVRYMCCNLEILDEIVRSKVEGLNQGWNTYGISVIWNATDERK